MRRLILAAASVAALSGCAEYFAGKEAFRAEARVVAAEEFETARYIQCRGTSIGAIGDYYGLDALHWEAYRQACLPYWRPYAAPVPAPQPRAP